ncbi:MAG: DUF6449 domain-containing protein [Lachnospiraceae bacterium]|jgi:hypothetical protein|nr:DUF6449 domain-containing protein [Lachnospiraceae bacterium]
MTSKNSFFPKKQTQKTTTDAANHIQTPQIVSWFRICCYDFKRRIWFLAISALINILFVIVPFLVAQTQFFHNQSISANLDWKIKDYFLSYFQADYFAFIGSVAIFMAILGAVSGFHYLQSRKESDRFHSLPVKRSRFFFVVYGNGLVIWLVPLLLCSLLVLVLTFTSIGGFSAAILQSVGKGILVTLMIFLIIYHFALLCVMISGNLLNTFFAMMVFGLGTMITYALLQFLFLEYLSTFITFSIPADALIWTAPFFSVLRFLIEFVSDPAWKSQLWGLYLGSSTLMALHLFLAWKLYCKRASELAGMGIENKWIQRFLRIPITFIMGLAGAFFFRMIFLHIDTGALGLTIFGCLLGAILSFGISNMIFDMSFRSFLRHKVQMLICCGATLIFFLCIVGGWFGYNRWIPDKNDIQSATFYFSNYHDNTYRYYVSSYGEFIRQPSDTILQNGVPSYQPTSELDASDFRYGNMNYTNIDSIHQALVTLVQNSRSQNLTNQSDILYMYPIPSEVRPTTFPVEVKITLDNGLHMYRHYSLNEMDFEAFWPILDSPEFRYHFFRLSENQIDPPKVVEFADFSHTTYQITRREDIQALFDAYQADFDAHYTPNELRTGLSIGYINFSFFNELYTQNSLEIHNVYENTISLLRTMFPDAIFDWEDLGIQAVNLSFPNLLNEQSLDTIGSWYGLSGYESMDKTMEDLFATWSQIAIQMGPDTVWNASPQYQLLITDPAQLSKLSEFLYFGNNSTINGAPLSYLSIGTAYLDRETAELLSTPEITDSAVQDNSAQEIARLQAIATQEATPTVEYPLYVKVGELPQEWIERIMAGD